MGVCTAEACRRARALYAVVISARARARWMEGGWMKRTLKVSSNDCACGRG